VQSPAVLAAGALLAVVLLWTYLDTLWWLASIWWSQPDYNHGFFVPVFAAFLLWLRRDMILESPPATGYAWLWAIPFFVAWAGMRWASLYLNLYIVDPLSLLPALAGMALFIGGWPALRWSWPAIVFLFFMVPLPRAAAGMLSQPLQHIATVSSVYIVQTLGIASLAQGNVIVLTTGPLNVAEACSGLRMMMLFFAVCVGAAFVLRVPAWEKAVIVLSAPPIAVFSNVARITLTAILYEVSHRWPMLVSAETADHFFHGLAGVLMMPLGLAILWGEMALLSKLLMEPLPETPLAFGDGDAGVRRPVEGGGRRQPSWFGP